LDKALKGILGRNLAKELVYLPTGFIQALLHPSIPSRNPLTTIPKWGR